MKASIISWFVFMFFCCQQNYAQILSQFEKAGLTDFLIDKEGIYHVVYQEYPDYNKPIFIYYTTSKNSGKTWSKPINISDDNTGNGAGMAKILQDVNGKIYVIWKRYGSSKSEYSIKNPLLDGPGGDHFGTIFYKVLQNNTWSNAVMLNEVEASQNSWFATVNPWGNVVVFWSQISNDSYRNNIKYWYYADYLRVAVLNGTSYGTITDFSTPSKPIYDGGYPPKEGVRNLNGYIDKNNLAHMVYEEIHDGKQEIRYFDGKKVMVIYAYPKYTTHNTFNYPPNLLVDENGIEHIVFKPDASTLASEQLWYYTPTLMKTDILVAIKKSGVKINAFQAFKSNKGEIAITFQAGNSTTIDNFGLFYKNGNWINVALTKNGSKESFFAKEFIGLAGYNTVIATLTKYNAKFSCVAWNSLGKKAMVMNVEAYWTAGSYSTASPSIIFQQIDK